MFSLFADFFLGWCTSGRAWIRVFWLWVFDFVAKLNVLVGLSLLSSSSSFRRLFCFGLLPPHFYTCERGPVGVRLVSLDEEGALMKDDVRPVPPGRRKGG